MTDTPRGNEAPRGLVAERLNHIFQEVHPGGRGPYTNLEVAEGIREAAGENGNTLSASLIQALRSGAKDNPTRTTLEALGAFFGVRPSFFIDPDEDVEQTMAQIAVLAAMRDNKIRSIALRAHGLSGTSLQMVANVINTARQLEGLPEAEDAGLDLDN